MSRQKDESQNACFKKTKHAKFSKNKHFLPSDTHTYVCESGGEKCSFFGKFGMLSFLETPFLRFALFPLAKVLAFLLVKYDFLTILHFCFSRMKSHFLGNTIAEVDWGTLPTHNIGLFSQNLTSERNSV